MVRLGIIGAGNIVRSRHLPALQRAKDRYSVCGIVDRAEPRAREVAHAFGIPRWDCFDASDLASISWLGDVDALLVATTPMTHGSIVLQALAAKKHVLVEKPFVVDMAEGRLALEAAEREHLILALNHNFQFSRAFTQLETDLGRGALGEIRGFYSLQLSNDTRRLPAWCEELPLGLFYDESPHVMYLLRRFAGEPELRNVAHVTSSIGRATPHVLSLTYDCRGIPASVHMDFESPICEWGFSVLGSRGFAHVDLFRDIYTLLPNDGRHLMREVLRTSGLATLQHWQGFIRNGLSYVRGNLLYGFDVVHRNFAEAVRTGTAQPVSLHSGADGLAVNAMQYAVVERA
jgi:predicted dehydrogenase